MRELLLIFLIIGVSNFVKKKKEMDKAKRMASKSKPKKPASFSQFLEEEIPIVKLLERINATDHSTSKETLEKKKIKIDERDFPIDSQVLKEKKQEVLTEASELAQTLKERSKEKMDKPPSLTKSQVDMLRSKSKGTTYRNEFVYSENPLVQGIIMSEILNKPKAMRK